MGEIGSKIEVSVSKDAASLNLEGVPADQLQRILSDLLSPFTNSIGYIGDKVNQARFVSAIKATAKAKKLLDEEGITYGDLPPKILLPWLEGVSLEHEEDEKISDYWAGLLARAVKSSDAINVSYIETLKRIGIEEAKLLEFFSGDTSPSFGSYHYGVHGENAFSERNPLFMAALRRISQIEDAIERREDIEGLGLQAMQQIIFVSEGGGAFSPTKFYRKNESAISNLEHLGLIKIERSGFVVDNYYYGLVWFKITKYAFDLFWACKGVQVAER